MANASVDQAIAIPVHERVVVVKNVLHMLGGVLHDKVLGDALPVRKPLNVHRDVQRLANATMVWNPHENLVSRLR